MASSSLVLTSLRHVSTLLTKPLNLLVDHLMKHIQKYIQVKKKSKVTLNYHVTLISVCINRSHSIITPDFGVQVLVYVPK